MADTNRWALALNEAVEQKEKIAKRLKDFKLEAPTRRGVHIALTGVGGAIHGALIAKSPSFKLGDTEIKSPLAVGGALAVLAITDRAGAYSDQLGAIAGGILACEASRMTQEALAS